MTIFFEIALALVLAAFCGIVFYLLKQPTITGFIFAGIIISYLGGLQHAEHLDVIEGLSSIGVALLLFIVGLEMRVKDLRDLSLISVAVGVGQMLVAFLGGYWIASHIGFTNIASLYIGAALSFSSSVIVIKVLSEKKDLKSLYGRIAIGFLLVQDIFVMLLLIFLSGLHEGGNVNANFVFTLVKGAIFAIFAFWASKILPKFLDFIGASTELLYLFSLSWAIGVSALFAAPFMGLSVEVGGLLAGMSLASSAEHFQISAKLKPLRDFFLIIFFVGLGAKMLSGGEFLFKPIFLFLPLILIIGPLVVFLIMSAAKYRARTAFMTSLAAIPLSEFSFVAVFIGERLGHLAPSEVSMIAMIGIISILLFAYLMVHGASIYKFLKPVLKIFESKKHLVEERGEDTFLENHIVLVGVHRMGYNILRALSDSGEDFVAVDFDPRIIETLRESNLPALYGDISDPEIQELVSLDRAKLVISTIPDFKDNLALLEVIKRHNPAGWVIMTAETEHQAAELYAAKADYVLLPHFVGGLEIADMILKDKEMAGLAALRARDASLINREIA